MIEATLVLLKADVGTLNNPYVVFGIEGDAPTADNPHRPRPKLTLDAEQWIAEGRPTRITLVVQEVREEVAA